MYVSLQGDKKDEITRDLRYGTLRYRTKNWAPTSVKYQTTNDRFLRGESPRNIAKNHLNYE